MGKERSRVGESNKERCELVNLKKWFKCFATFIQKKKIFKLGLTSF